MPGCVDPDREAMLLTAISLRRAAFRSLLRGHTASFDEIARAAGLSEGAARKVAEDVASAGMAEIDGTNVVGMDGLTTRQTQHRLALNGVDLFT